MRLSRDSTEDEPKCIDGECSVCAALDGWWSSGGKPLKVLLLLLLLPFKVADGGNKKADGGDKVVSGAALPAAALTAAAEEDEIARASGEGTVLPSADASGWLLWLLTGRASENGMADGDRMTPENVLVGDKVGVCLRSSAVVLVGSSCGGGEALGGRTVTGVDVEAAAVRLVVVPVV